MNSAGAAPFSSIDVALAAGLPAAPARPRLLLVCPTPWEEAAMAAPAIQERFEILRCADELREISPWKTLRFRTADYLDRLAARVRPLGIVGVIGCGDYPGCLLAAGLAERLGLPGPALSTIVRMGHKAESRKVQARVVPEATPAFVELSPLARTVAPLRYPCFVKPVRGSLSWRAQRVERAADLRPALRWSAREAISVWTVLWPYGQMLREVQVPGRAIWNFIAEEPLQGCQVTVEGFVQQGEITVMGVVDSVMFPGTISFRQFDYPSVLPDGVTGRMVDIARRLVAGAGLDHTCFNIEMFYDEGTDQIRIIEMNPRMAYQFSDLYLLVDGLSSMEVQVCLSTGVKVPWHPRAGAWGAATSFVGRRFVDGRVRRVPSAAEIAAVSARFPTAHTEVLCKVGDQLSKLPQDMASFRYCITNLAAPTRDQLMADYAVVEQMLPYEFDDLPSGA